MITTKPNYSQIVEKDGKKFLFDENAFNKRAAAIDTIDATFAQTREWLAANDYPTTPDYVAGVVFDRDFLRKKTVEETENAAKRLRLPRHIVKIHIQAAEQAVADLDTAQLDEILQAYQRTKEAYGLNISPATVYYDDGKVYVERKTVEEELRRGCLRQVPDAVFALADFLKEITPKLREFDDMGLPVLAVLQTCVGNYLAPHLRPDLNDPQRETALIATLVTNARPSRQYLRTVRREDFFLNGGQETEQEKALHGESE